MSIQRTSFGYFWQFCLMPVLLGALGACQPTANTSGTHAATHASQPSALPAVRLASSTEVSNDTADKSNTDGTLAKAHHSDDTEQIVIDWTQIESNTPKVKPADFDYPFALDSAPVKAYMDAYQVDAKTARYNLTVGMAVNEVLGKILDQIGTAYVSHELTAGKDSQFVIHTTAKVQPSRYDYTFAEPFARGLSLPVQIINDGVKPKQTANAHPPVDLSAAKP